MLRRLWLVVAVAVSLTAPRLALALTQEEHQFASFLINELRYFDTASRWIQSIEARKNLDQTSRADLASLKIDILQREGKLEEASRALEVFSKQYPNHRRASLGALEQTGIALQEIQDLLRNANSQPPEQAVPLFDEAHRQFEARVAGPLEASIGPARKAYDAKQKTQGFDPAKHEDELRAIVHQELARLNLYLEYCRWLPGESLRRKQLLEHGLKLATTFVEVNFDFPVMQYKGQLALGIYNYELGQYAQAEENLGILYGIPAPSTQPSPALVDALVKLRLHAILYGCRANNQAGNYTRAQELIETNFMKSSGDVIDLSKARDNPAYRTESFLIRLEYGLSLVGNGKEAAGLEEIQKVINAPGQSEGMVNDARRVLGRMAIQVGGRLRGKDYYQAALGLKSDLHMDHALEALQLALGSLSLADPGDKNILPLCLNQMGEINYLLNRPLESALAYQEACKRCLDSRHEVYAKVAQNYLAAVGKAIKARPDGTKNPALAKLKEEATGYSEKRSGGLGGAQSKLFDANRALEEGKYADAAKAFLEVPRDIGGTKVPFYWAAQASARECVYHQWNTGNDVAKKNVEPQLRAAAAELEGVVKSALADNEREGASKASLIRGQIHAELAEWPQAVAALAVFATQLKGESRYGCRGLGLLVIAEVRAKDLAAAESHLAMLESGCKDEPVTALAARELADGYREAKDSAKAAEYILHYAQHPSSAEDMKDSAMLARIAEMLIAGNRMKEAETYMGLIKAQVAAKPEGGAPTELDRQVVYLDAQVLKNQKKWNDVIARLESYLEKFGANKNISLYDPYVYRNLAEAYLARSEPKPAPKEDLVKADVYLNSACALIQERMGLDPSLEAVYWQWLLEFLQVRVKLGDLGDPNRYREVVALVKQEQGDMGGLREQFLELQKHATQKLGGK